MNHAGDELSVEKGSLFLTLTDAAFGVPTEYGQFSLSITEKLEYLADQSVPAPTDKAHVFWIQSTKPN